MFCLAVGWHLRGSPQQHFSSPQPELGCHCTKHAQQGQDKAWSPQRSGPAGVTRASPEEPSRTQKKGLAPFSSPPELYRGHSGTQKGSLQASNSECSCVSGHRSATCSTALFWGQASGRSQQHLPQNFNSQGSSHCQSCRV